MAIRSYSVLGMLLPPIIIMAHDYWHVLSTINACWVYHVESVSKMGLVLSITFCNIWGCMCWTGPFEFRWLKGYIYNPSYYHNQIGSICKRSDTLWPAGRVRLFADYTILLSSLCRLIWRHWTNKMLVRYMLPSVCLRLRLFSQLSFIQYMGLCVFSLLNSPVMICLYNSTFYFRLPILAHSLSVIVFERRLMSPPNWTSLKRYWVV